MREYIFSILEDQSGFSFEEVTVNILASALIGLFIFISYYISHRETIYSKKFNVSLVVLTVLTSTVMTVIGNNIALSLGMVGALSIVRFRTAIKDPMDLAFLFWSISIGIICGAGLYEIALVTSVGVTVFILVLDMLPVGKAPMMLVVNSSEMNGEKAVLDVVGKYARYYKVKSRNLSKGRLDLVIELKVKEESALVSEVAALGGMLSASMISHDGEVTF